MRWHTQRHEVRQRHFSIRLYGPSKGQNLHLAMSGKSALRSYGIPRRMPALNPYRKCSRADARSCRNANTKIASRSAESKKRSFIHSAATFRATVSATPGPSPQCSQTCSPPVFADSIQHQDFLHSLSPKQPVVSVKFRLKCIEVYQGHFRKIVQC